jgi:hypothetical protein
MFPSSNGDLPIYRAENPTEKTPVSAQPPRRVLPTTRRDEDLLRLNYVILPLSAESQEK